MARHPDSNEFRKLLKHIKKNKFFIPLILLLSIIIVVAGFLVFYFLTFNGRVYPNISIAGVSIAGEKPSEATAILSQKINSQEAIVLTYQDLTFKINPSDVDFSYDLGSSIKNAYGVTRTGNFINDLTNRLNLLLYPKNIDLVFNINDDKLTSVLASISDKVSVKPKDPSLKLVNEVVVIDKGAPGSQVDQNSLKEIIYSALSKNDLSNIEIPVSMIDDSLNQNEIQDLRSQSEKFIGKDLQMKFEYNTFNLSDSDIIGLINPMGGYTESSISAEIQKISDNINRDPQNPKFVFENGKVTIFQPSLDGVTVDTEKLKELLTTSLNSLSDSTEKTLSFNIPIITTPPEITTDKVNSLGIKEIIGRGTSTYYHSVPSRVHNVVLAASRINGTLVKPGETFSFNQTLGDVSAFTGYQQAYIISEGKTVLGDGGGVCQVSTTLFRAVLNAGLPVVERQAHAYRVGYYEQDSPPGLDATVYSPSPDLKFTNNSPAYILIEAAANPKNYSLVFELYGSSDGRISTISKPVVSNVTAPPPDLYQDDPTLPIGTIKQIDFKAWGAKVTFDYSVKRDGKEIYNKTFVSNYQPWQAIYLRGTGPIH